MKYIVDSPSNSINIVAASLLLTTLYESTANAMVTNKLLNQTEQLTLIEIGQLLNKLSLKNGGIIHSEQFLLQARQIIATKVDKFGDNYYNSIFT